jgi:hypothetical protein
MNDEIDDILAEGNANKDIGVRTERFRERDIDDLIENIKLAANINEHKRNMFLRLADLFLPKMSDMLFKNQFDLAKEFPETTADEWTSFLMDNMVAKYIGRHKNMFLKSTAENNLSDPYAKGKKDSLNLVEKINNEVKQDNKQNIIIMRIPGVGGRPDDKQSNEHDDSKATTNDKPIRKKKKEGKKCQKKNIKK